MITFEKDNTAILSLEQLKSTVHENDCQGKPIMGMHHYEMFERAADILTARNIKFEIEPITIIQNANKSRPGATLVESLAVEHGNNSERAHILRRLFGKINLLDYRNDEVNRIMAFIYTQEGLQIAIGSNVRICSNLTIFGAENLISTYASLNQRVGFEKLFDVVPSWIDNLELGFQKDLNTIEQFKDTYVGLNDLEELIGTLTLERIRRDVYKGRAPIALNQGQISQFAQEMVPLFEKNDYHVPLWQVYNSGTFLQKAGKNDIPILFENNITWGDVLIREFLNKN